jgi:hypothetical protein
VERRAPRTSPRPGAPAASLEGTSRRVSRADSPRSAIGSEVTRSGGRRLGVCRTFQGEGKIGDTDSRPTTRALSGERAGGAGQPWEGLRCALGQPSPRPVSIARVLSPSEQRGAHARKSRVPG